MQRYLVSAVFVLGSLGYALHLRGEAAEHPVGTPVSMAVASSTEATPVAEPVTREPVVSVVTTAPKPAPAPTPTPTPKPTPTPTGMYRNGTYPGSAADAYYGTIQVAVVISGGKLTDVKVLQFPNDRHDSVSINSQALPYLIEEAISAQSAKVHTISGATDTSDAFRQSLGAALAAAQA